LGLVEKQDKIDRGSGQNIESGNHRIAEGSVGAVRFRTLLAQDKNSGDGQCVKNQNGENHVVEQVVVEIAVATVGIAGPREDEQSNPDSLKYEGRTWHPLLVELPCGTEEQSVLRHGVGDARTGEDQAIVAAERGDDDGDSHYSCAGRAEDRVERRC